MDYFVDEGSIVRKVWGKSDTVLFIFAGASAEFALNKAVDWLYFTGRLPTDPIGRLFSTVVYAQQIVFSERSAAEKAIDKISAIHSDIESSRKIKIPDWAYRDVLFMLIHYSQAAYELLERKMTEKEKQELYDVFYRLGARMGLKELPVTYKEWTTIRQEHLQQDLEKSFYTIDLYKQYRKHLGWLRYQVLIESQKHVVPKHVKQLLKMRKFSLFTVNLFIYKFFRRIKMDGALKYFLLPKAYKRQIKQLDIKSS